jgi:formamidopyrimidine-DNA glycosylase
MPELPEVETVRRGLCSDLVGATIDSVEVLHPRSVRRQPGGSDELAFGLFGQTVRGAHRRGKYLWLDFQGTHDALVVHLGMSGQLRLVEQADSDRHARIDLGLKDGRTLRFRDQRTFGWMLFGGTTVASGQRIPDSVAHIAPDPFGSTFDIARVLERMANSRAAIKRVLLDQTVVSGIGNIYADEALWRAKVHYTTPARELRTDQARSVITSATAVMAEAVDSGGTSFDALYVDVDGDKGWFERSLAAYGREDEPCPRCAEPIRREKFTNRSSFLCPNCQRP